MHANAITQALRFTAILADGEKLRAIRWASDDHPPSLYWRRLDTGIAIASEPFGDAGDTWQPVPSGSVMTATNGEVSFAEFAAA